MGQAAGRTARGARRQIEGKKNRVCVFRRFQSQNYRLVSNCARHAPFFLSICLLISIFPRAEPEYVCSPSAQGEGGELQWREDGATKRNRREKRGAVRRKRGTKQKYSRRPIHFFPTVFVPLLSEHVASVQNRRHVRLSPTRALPRQPVSVFYLHSFTRMPHYVVSEGVEGEGLWCFKFTCVPRVRRCSDQSVRARGR